MRRRLTYSWAVVLTLLLVCSGFVGLSQLSETAGSERTISPAIGCRGGSSPRTVLVEKFTSDWCRWCVSQAWVIDRLANELGHENLVVLEYHNSASDELYVSNASARASFYASKYLPTVIFDGGGPYVGNNDQPSPNGEELWVIGGWPGRYTGYDYDKSLYDEEKLPSANSNLTIQIDGNITGSRAYVHVRVTATDPITETNLKVRFAVYQSEIYHRDGNTVENAAGHHRVYNHVVRMTLPEESLPPTFNQGDSVDYYKTFSIGSWYPSTDKRKLGVAALVQTDNRNSWVDVSRGDTYYNAPVLQAAAYNFVEDTVLLVNGDSTDTYDEGMERFDDVLTKEAVPYTVWDTLEPGDSSAANLRTMPDISTLQNYGAAVWYTGEATSTFSGSDRTTIGAYLSGNGNIFVTGEDIGQDSATGGWSTWYLSNLHASFITDTMTQTTVDGIALDPITDGLSGLGVTDSSPSRISPGIDANEILVYSGTPFVAGIRATHDPDSRVVYLAFDYFEGTDTYPSDVGAETIMDKTIYWLDGAAPPSVQIIQPTAGELVLRETSYSIKWRAVDVEIPQDGVDIEYSTDSGSTWNPVTSNDVNDGIHYWSVPAVSSSNSKIRICVRDSNGQQTCTESQEFRIGTPNIPPEPPMVTGATLSGAGFADVDLTWQRSPDDGGGQNDIIAYYIYSSAVLGGPQSLLFTYAASGSPSYTWTCVGCGDGNPNQYFFYVWAYDGEDQTVSPTVAGKFTESLNPGWSFVSIPLIQSDPSPAVVLQTIESGRAAYYDALDQADHWKRYDTNKNVNDLTAIDHTIGFWLFTPGGDDLTVAGIVPQMTNITLQRGWNMVGFPSFNTTYTIQDMISETSVTRAEAFDPAASPYRLRAISIGGADLMSAGAGYWVYATSTTIWAVP